MSLFRPVPRAALPAAVLLAALVAGTDAAAQAPRHAALSTSAALVRPSAEGLTPRPAPPPCRAATNPRTPPAWPPRAASRPPTSKRT